MKIATMIAAAALAASVFAEEPAAKPAAPEDAVSAPAAARGPKPAAKRSGERMRAPGMMVQDPIVRALSNPRLAEKIGLTAEQKAKLGDAGELRAKSRELQAKARKATERQMELLQAEPIDEAAVMAAIDESFEARKALAKEQTKRLILVRSVLTPEQVKKARDEMKATRERGDRSGAKRGPKPPHPPKDGPGNGPKDAPKDGPEDAPKGE